MMETIFTRIQTYNGESPLSFIIIIFFMLVLFRKWGILLLSLLTLFLGWYARDLIILHLITHREIVSVPLVIYGIGGTLIGVVSLITFIKYMLT